MRKILRGDIYYIAPVSTCGSEQGGYRPAIVVSNNANNRNSKVVEFVYLTMEHKKPLPTHVRIYSSPQVSTALCEHPVPVDISRLRTYIGSVTKQEMEGIDTALKIGFDLNGGEAIASVYSKRVKALEDKVKRLERKLR